METTLQQRLAEPFGLDEVEFRAGATSGNRALALAYIDARVVMDRLDGVLGCENWQDHYEALPSGCVKCVLSLRLGGEWVSKEDVGGPSDQKDVGDHTKAAFSDALKRAAVKFGVGRYLYSLPAAWTDYDPQKKQLLRPPQLPAWALPAKAAAKPAPQAAPAANGHGSAHALPATADELSRRLSAKDKAMTEAGLCRAGELVRHVHAVITAERLAESVVKLDPKHFGRVAEAVREFEGARAPAKAGAA